MVAVAAGLVVLGIGLIVYGSLGFFRGGQEFLWEQEATRYRWSGIQVRKSEDWRRRMENKGCSTIFGGIVVVIFGLVMLATL